MTRTVEEKQHALLRQAERGRVVRSLLEDDSFKGLVSDLREELIEGMIAVTPEDDALRRSFAFQIAALDKLVRHLQSFAGIGDKALDQLNKLKATPDGK